MRNASSSPRARLREALVVLSVLLVLPLLPSTSAASGRFFPRHPHLPRVRLVWPGESIQAAVDAAVPGSWILVLPGVYHETSDPTGTNALQVTKSGIHLIGLSHGRRRVVLENAGGQRNGIVVVPDDRTACMDCHSSLAPPFALLPDAPHPAPSIDPVLYDFTIRGFTIKGFDNNGLFTERVDGFRIKDVHSIDNLNYGIFPTRSRHGEVEDSFVTGSDDAGIWVEASQDVEVEDNLVEGNVNGLEVSNSIDVLFEENESRNNTAGALILLESDLVPIIPASQNVVFRRNWIHDNNKPNTGTPGTLLAEVPSGTGILNLGSDDTRIELNRVENNGFFGLAIVNFCLVVAGTPFSCTADPPAFDPLPENNAAVDNVFVNNGTNPPAGQPFAFAAADITLVTFVDRNNCFSGNTFGTFFSVIGAPPACP